MTTKTASPSREDVLRDAAWSAHAWIVDKALSKQIQKMCPADISVGVCKAIREGYAL